MNLADLKSHIFITADIAAKTQEIQSALASSRVVVFAEDEFKIEQAKAVIAEAYISESETKYIVMCANSFNTFAQNTLLKILEEPPRNIEFILITSSKSTLLPTICSRMPVSTQRGHNTPQPIDISFKKIDYEKVFLFLKSLENIKKDEAKKIVEAMLHKATVVEKIKLSAKQLEHFETAFKLIELNSRPVSVIGMVVMSFAKEANAA